MTSLEQAYGTRDFVLQRLEEDLLGGPLDARLHEAPLSRFVMGVLYPDVDGDAPIQASIEDDVENDVDAETGGDAPDNSVDPAVSMSRVRHPRSMGMTIALEQTARASLEVSVDATRYEEADEGEWRAVDITTKQILVSAYPARLERLEVVDGLELVVHCREPRGGAAAVTLTLVNTQRAPQGEKDAFSWFRPRIAVRSVDAALRERPPATVAGVDEFEIQSQQLLFRDVRSFAVGHGCAVAWEGRDPDTVETTYLPRYELLLSDAAGGDGLDLSMDALAADESFDVLERLIADYRDWISGLPGDVTEALDDEQEATLQRHMREARAASDRMAAGLELLRTDANVRKAFQMTNLAMAQQRSRQEHHRSGGQGDPQSTAGASWRPFQIAFILTNLSGLADADHPDREHRRPALVPHRWWQDRGLPRDHRHRDPAASAAGPEGGRRVGPHALHPSAAHPAAVPARHRTYLRARDRAPGPLARYRADLDRPLGRSGLDPERCRHRTPGPAEGPPTRARDTDDDVSDPVQLRRCPWCGNGLDHTNYEIVDRTWMRVSCGNDTCAFRNGLPVHIIDSDVYSNRPSLVIGTVDKFAMMPWKREVGALLGAGEAVADPNFDYLPPDLIVQDELHLISGPLGTMVGLYETAVDGIAGAACPPPRSWRPRPRSDARPTRCARSSTGTARQFPPPGLTQRDSFFAVEAPRAEKASRAVRRCHGARRQPDHAHGARRMPPCSSRPPW